jgi:hypothetical protein
LSRRNKRKKRSTKNIQGTKTNAASHRIESRKKRSLISLIRDIPKSVLSIIAGISILITLHEAYKIGHEWSPHIVLQAPSTSDIKTDPFGFPFLIKNDGAVDITHLFCSYEYKEVIYKNVFAFDGSAGNPVLNITALEPGEESAFYIPYPIGTDQSKLIHADILVTIKFSSWADSLPTWLKKLANIPASQSFRFITVPTPDGSLTWQPNAKHGM